MGETLQSTDLPRFGARLFLFVATMPKGTRRLFNRFLFQEAKETADSRDYYCKRALIVQLYHYFDPNIVTEFLFSNHNHAALQAYQTLPFDTFYQQFGPSIDLQWSNKTYDTFDSPTIFDANPEAINELNIADYQQLFALAQERGNNSEPPDFSKIGYLSFFYKADLTDDDCAMVNRLYCQGELLYDMFDFVCSEPLTTSIRKRAADTLTAYLRDCGDPAFIHWVHQLADNYRQMNPSKHLMVVSTSPTPPSDAHDQPAPTLLPRQCLHGCPREAFIASLQEQLISNGYVATDSDLDSLFEGTTHPLKPVIWKRTSYEFAFFLRALCPFLEHKEELAVLLFRHKSESKTFQASSLRSARSDNQESVIRDMDLLISTAKMHSHQT